MPGEGVQATQLVYRNAGRKGVGPRLQPLLRILFRLQKEPVDELMGDRPEIAQGVIRSLVCQIRK